MVQLDAIDSIAEIDNLLTRARAVPADDRTPTWHEIVDGLLERRAELEGR